MTRWLAVIAALTAICSISLVLWWGTSGQAGTPSFEVAVLILNIATPLASLLLTWHLWRGRFRRGAVLSASPLVLLLVGTGFALNGAVPSLRVLLWLDLYVLVAFGVVLLWLGPKVIRGA
jgi:hypothetical protein